jgi:hypothetical protein
MFSSVGVLSSVSAGAFVGVPLLIGFTTSESVHEINAYELQWGMEEDRQAQVSPPS